MQDPPLYIAGELLVLLLVLVATPALRDADSHIQAKLWNDVV